MVSTIFSSLKPRDPRAGHYKQWAMWWLGGLRLAAPVNCIPVIFSWMVFQEPEWGAALQCHLSRSGHGAVMQPPLIITSGQQCNNDQFRWRENQGKFCHSTASSSSLVAVLVTINSEVQGLDIYLLLVTCCLATWWSLWRQGFTIKHCCG